MGVTAVSRTEVGLAQVGCVGIASAAVSHSEGSLVTRVAVQSRGPGGTHHEVTYLQLGSPAICMCVWVLAYADKRLTILHTYSPTPTYTDEPIAHL